MEYPVSNLQQFLWGFLGSLAVEIVQIHCLLDTSRKLPLRYSRPIYWIARLLLALTAGGLAVAYDIETPVLALHVGAATPLIVQALAQNLGHLLGAHGEDRIERRHPHKRTPTGRRTTPARDHNSDTPTRLRRRRRS
jgi:hypothetical protein